MYAVAQKRRLRTRSGSPYLALELVDKSGRIEARVWNDVELLDTRFEEGDAVRVLGRVEQYRDRLQLEVRTLEAAAGADPADLLPTIRRDADELDGFRATDEGRLLGHVHLGLRIVEERHAGLKPEVLAELLHAIASHHDARAARTAEASVLYHANQLDAVAATRPVTE